MANPYTYSGHGEGFLTDYSNISAAGSAFQGFVEGWQKASDSQMKQTEHAAQMEALKTKAEREVMQNSLAEQKKKITLDLANHNRKPIYDSSGQLIDTQIDPEYIKLQETRAEMDPFGLKRLSAENANRPKEFEFVSAGYAKRMQGAEQKYKSLLGTGFDPASTTMQAEEAIMRGPLESGKRGPTKQYEQIVRDFASAILRKESGAAISPQEYAETRKLYFPQPGDTPEVIAQKEQSRIQAFNNLRAQGGKAFDITPSAPGLVPKGLVGKKGLVGGGAPAK
jgi:hypothetical protein